MKMLIGLTGRTGSGKSTAAQIFEKLGAYVVDCDKIAHEILYDDAVKKELIREFSDEILDENGDIARKKLGAIVFSDKESLSTLNSITHGAIADRALGLCNASGKDICIIDGSEIESSGVYKKCAYVVVITADEAVRLERIISRDKITTEDALLRIRSQKDYSKEAVFVSNNGDSASLEKEITLLYNKFSGELNALHP